VRGWPEHQFFDDTEGDALQTAELFISLYGCPENRCFCDSLEKGRKCSVYVRHRPGESGRFLRQENHLPALARESVHVTASVESVPDRRLHRAYERFLPGFNSLAVVVLAC
jgi:hypothetical protein